MKSNKMKNAYENKFITGYKKFLFFQYLKMYVFFRYTGKLLSKKITLKQHTIFLKRALLFLNKVKVNKVVKTLGVYKMHIYFPAFPTKSFFKALDKFLVLRKDDLNPVSVLLSIGKGCRNNCKHCYQRFDTKKELPLEDLKELTRQLLDLKISFINIEGGEPLIKFDRLIEVMKIINNRAEVWVNTSGFNLTEEKAKKMKEVGVFGVMISVHHWDKKKHDEFTGRIGSFDDAIRALKLFKRAGISTAINCVGTQELLKDDGFDKVMQIAKETGCSIVQLIHEKPAGAWIGKNDTMQKEYLRKLYNYHLIYNLNKKYKDYPVVSSQVWESTKNNFGCTAGGIERFYVNGNGDVQPCEFVNVSFGNIKKENFLEIYKKMRKVFDKPRTNWICCTEHNKINKELKKLKNKLTPLSKEKSEKIINSFDFGEETLLYRKMGLYD
ncbi:MAG: radical SAM protein [Candidatus Pacearchaeota archaeon]|nr:radical SAM protein [Candidatus Pacearchaeota archaeon]